MDKHYNSDLETAKFEKLIKAVVSHYNFKPVSLGEQAVVAFRSLLSTQEQAEFHARHILLQRSKVKFRSPDRALKQHRVSYFVEMSMFKSRIFVLAVDETNAARKFDSSTSLASSHVLNNNTNTILLHPLWKKQIQTLFLQTFNYRKMMMMLQGKSQATLSKAEKIKFAVYSLTSLLSCFEIRYGKLIFD